ncbi:MAG TPA: M12 family metallopeptidase [Nitriliruptorales bacterium]|nr:M12 family metallopeptidase [Nitriliruptorales bacterium]
MANDDELRASDEELAAANEGFMSSGDVRTGFISGVTFTNKPIQYEVVDGLAFFEGCICLGRAEELERDAGLIRAAATEGGVIPAAASIGEDALIAHGVAITGSQYRWPNAVLPYEVDGGLPNQSRVTDAVAHFHQRTTLRLVERTAANASQYPNYVRVFRGDGCWSYVGMQGGRQDLSLADGCGFGATVHEFSHAFGLWHEQSREDRDQFVTINWQNIQAGREHNFNQHITDGDDIGGYDYGSLMHYGMYAFSKNNLPTIVPKQSGVTIGQRDGLSTGDIAALHQLYRGVHLVWVRQTFATTASKNAWAYVEGAGITTGWRKIDPNAPDGVTNTLSILAASRAFDKQVYADLDGGQIYAAYGN